MHLLLGIAREPASISVLLELSSAFGIRGSWIRWADCGDIFGAIEESYFEAVQHHRLAVQVIVLPSDRVRIEWEKRLDGSGTSCHHRPGIMPLESKPIVPGIVRVKLHGICHRLSIRPAYLRNIATILRKLQGRRKDWLAD